MEVSYIFLATSSSSISNDGIFHETNHPFLGFSYGMATPFKRLRNPGLPTEVEPPMKNPMKMDDLGVPPF